MSFFRAVTYLLMQRRVYPYIAYRGDASITMNVYNHSSFERTEKEVQ